uniref:non-specific serine/threonine protein kinase n=1 Tax=Romanomermis culicivorax TaxID=13658 RepID=A0A915K197_ROMCU
MNKAGAFALKRSANSSKLLLSPRNLKPQLTSPDSSPLLFVRYSTTEACNALVQSPCRLDRYHQQRRRLYDDFENLSLKSNLVAETSKGGFGSVFIGKYDGKPVAIKQLHAGRNKAKVNGESLCAELNAFRLNHENIVKILTFSLSGSTIQIVFEYVGRRTLQTLIDDPQEKLDFSRRKHFCLQLSAALAFCHERRVLHLDVKPSNVLLLDHRDDDPSLDVCKLADFGCSRILSPLQQSSTPAAVVDLRCSPIPAVNVFGAQRTTTPKKLHTPLTASTPSFAGTLIYKAPELLRGMPATTKCDVYSYAFVVWQLVTRRQPFDFADQHTIVFCVVAKNLRPSTERGLDFHTDRDGRLITLAKLCWDPEPGLRPEFSIVSSVLENIL